MQICDKCEGSGRISTTEDKLERVLTARLYETAKAKENVTNSNTWCVYFGRHTDYNGGVDGDMITNKEIDEFRKLGYYIGSVSKKFVYVLPIKVN